MMRLPFQLPLLCRYAVTGSTKHQIHTSIARHSSSLALTVIPPSSGRLPAVQRKYRLRWSAEELEVLKGLATKRIMVGKKPTHADFVEILPKLPNRTIPTIKVKFNMLYVYNSSLKSKKLSAWSAEEDAALDTALAMYGKWNWPEVAKFVGTRTAQQCYGRYVVLREPLGGTNISRNIWIHARSPKPQVENFPTYDEAVAADEVPLASGDAQGGDGLTRSDIFRKHYKEVRELEAEWNAGKAGAVSIRDRREKRILRMPFSKAEDELILRLYRLYGTRLSMIAGLVNVFNQKHMTQMPIQMRMPLSIRCRLLELDPHAKYRIRLSNLNSKTYKPGPEKRQSRKRWTPDEDQKLRDVVDEVLADQSVPFSWPTVAKLMGPGYGLMQCRTRYVEYAGQHVDRTSFTEEEDKLLWPFAVAGDMSAPSPVTGLKMYGTHGEFTSSSGEKVMLKLSWVIMTKLTHRSHSTVRNRVYRMQNCIMWLREVVKVDKPLDCFPLIHRLVNSPLTFRLGEVLQKTK